jgi:acyl-coenzyme A synthetase/AMP-(fatty) acid ligase
MRETIPLRQELEASPETALTVSTRGTVTYGDVVTAADGLAADLQGLRTQRLIVQPTTPAELITALLICSEAGIDLAIVHDGLDAAFCERVASDWRADTRFDPASPDVRLVPLREPTAEAHGTVTLMTSGTTDDPKLAEHDPAKLVDRILASASVQANRGGRWLLTYQPTAFAGIQVILTTCLTGGTLVVPADSTPRALVDAARDFGATHISGTPTFWRSFLIAGSGMALDSLRQITLGGEAVDQATLDRLRHSYPRARVTQIYASTEAGALFAVHDGRHGFPAAWLDGEIEGGVRLRVRDGELQVQSPRGMRGYSRRAAPLTDDGWLRTGDLVRLRGDRVLFSGRRDSIVNVGGMKVYPAEVESFLHGLPGIIEAKVRARPSPITGALLTAEVVLAPGADPDATRKNVLQRCRSALQRHEVPAVIRFVDQITVSRSWKKT